MLHCTHKLTWKIIGHQGKSWPVNSIFLISGTITFSHSIGEKMKHRYQSFTRIGRQFQSLEHQVYADWTSVSFPFCQRSCLIRRIMTNTLTNTMTSTYVVIFLSVSIFGRGYHSRYQNFEFTGRNLPWATYGKIRTLQMCSCKLLCLFKSKLTIKHATAQTIYRFKTFGIADTNQA